MTPRLKCQPTHPHLVTAARPCLSAKKLFSHPGYSRASKQMKRKLANEREITRQGAGNNFIYWCSAFFTDYRPVQIGASPFKRPATGLYGASQCLAIRQKTFPTPPHKKKAPLAGCLFFFTLCLKTTPQPLAEEVQIHTIYC